MGVYLHSIVRNMKHRQGRAEIEGKKDVPVVCAAAATHNTCRQLKLADVFGVIDQRQAQHASLHKQGFKLGGGGWGWGVGTVLFLHRDVVLI